MNGTSDFVRQVRQTEGRCYFLIRYTVRGGKSLNGEVTVSGAKNAAVAIIPAAVLVNGKCTIENVPDISDVRTLIEILREIGATVEYKDRTTVVIDCSGVNGEVSAVSDGVRKMRASYYLIGALLGRFGKATVGLPGGCAFDARPIDQHIKGFRLLGAEVDDSCRMIRCNAENGLTGTRIYLDLVSVGATINIMLAATGAQGLTVIENAAKEPHVVDVANFLNSMGADIRGAGTDIIKIRGGKPLGGGSYAIIPDQIEAGTYMVAAAAAGGKVRVCNVIPKHLESITAKLRDAGVTVVEYDDSVEVSRKGKLLSVRLKTQPYPGFPTDMQPQLTALMTVASGESHIREGVYDKRFGYVSELAYMGAKISVDDDLCIVNGVEKLTGAKVRSLDLRAGAAMIIAGLMAEGVTEIEDKGYIERGYEDLINKFRSIGADIMREEV